jgi:hypothetical protein
LLARLYDVLDYGLSRFPRLLQLLSKDHCLLPQSSVSLVNLTEPIQFL